MVTMVSRRSKARNRPRPWPRLPSRARLGATSEKEKEAPSGGTIPESDPA